VYYYIRFFTKWNTNDIFLRLLAPLLFINVYIWTNKVEPNNYNKVGLWYFWYHINLILMMQQQWQIKEHHHDEYLQAIEQTLIDQNVYLSWNNLVLLNSLEVNKNNLQGVFLSRIPKIIFPIYRLLQSVVSPL